MDTWDRFSRALEESKQAKKIDPDGSDDQDVDNDEDSDETDRKLLKRKKIIRARIAADRKKKIKEGCGCENSENDSKVKKIDSRELGTKLNLAKNKMRSMGLKMSQELEGEQLDELSLPGTGMVMAPKTDASTGVTSPMMQRKFLGMNVGGLERAKTPLKTQYGDTTQYSKSQVDRYNAQKNRPSTIKTDSSGFQSSVARPGFGPKPTAPKPVTSAPVAKPAPQQSASDRAVQGLRSAAGSGALGGLAQSLNRERAAKDAAMKMLNQSHDLGGEMVEGLIDTLDKTARDAATKIGGEIGAKQGRDRMGNLPILGDVGEKIGRSQGQKQGAETYDKVKNTVTNTLGSILKQNYQPEGSLIEGRKKDDSYLETDMKKRQSNNEKALSDMKRTKGYKDMVAAAHRHFETEETQIDEDKEYRREMAKAAARERAEERREKGSKAAKSPGREGPSAGKSYADYQEISIKAHDKLTKKNKNVIGLVSKEEVEYIEEKGMSKDEMSSILKGHKYSKQQLLDMSKKSTKEGRHGEAAAFYHEFQKEETEQLIEMPYQVYGSPDGKKINKIGKPVKSRRYAQNRADELSDTHKETGGKYHVQKEVQKEENDLDEGMTIKDFKANRKKLQRREASADARKRGHEGKEWHNTGRTYSPDEAKSNRTKLSDDDRAARHRVAVDPDDDRDENMYSADKTKNSKKLRKQKAMGELGEGYIEEMAVSRAQQRFMGMVRAAQEGKMKNPSSAVKSAAKSMTKKQAHDFAATKHAGLPEKKEETKEELSLVDKMIAEAIAGTIAGGKSRAKKYKVQAKDVRVKQIGSAALRGDEEEVDKLRKSNKNPTLKITKKGSEESEEISSKKSKGGEKKGRGKSDPSAIVRSGIIRGALKLKREKEKTKRQRERQEFTRQREKEQELKSKQQEIKDKKAQAIKSISAPKLDTIGHREPLGSGYTKLLGNTGKLIGSGIKLAAAGVKIARLHKKEKELNSNKNEQFSNWREEFIIEVDDAVIKDDIPTKIIDVSKKKNKIDINPNMSEAKSPAWQRSEGKNKNGGLNEKGRKSYETEHPGSDLKAPQPEGGSRRDSFCARMKGMKKKLTSAKTANDPDSRINKSLRAWNC
jgi:hypothetical protein